MPAGLATAYDLTVGVVLNVDPLIYMISPIDSPMLTGMNADGLSVAGVEGGLDNITFHWEDEDILTPRTTIQTGTTTGDAWIVVAAGDQLKFSTGDMLRIIHTGGAGKEYVRVTGYGSTTDSLTVTRGFDSTTARTVTAAAKVIGMGTSLAEGVDPENGRTVDRADRSNNTQIFGPTKVSMSRTEQRIRKYGVSNEFDHQFMNRMHENVISREQVAIYGRTYNSTTAKVRTTGGLLAYITTNVDSTSTQLTITKIEAAQQLCYNKGGMPTTLMANPASLTDLNDTSNVTIVRTDAQDTTRGRAHVTTTETEHGLLTIARNRWIEPTDAILFSRKNITRKVMDPLLVERLAKTGDSDVMMMVAEEGWKVKGQTHCATFSALSYTAAY